MIRVEAIFSNELLDHFRGRLMSPRPDDDRCTSRRDVVEIDNRTRIHLPWGGIIVLCQKCIVDLRIGTRAPRVRRYVPLELCVYGLLYCLVWLT